MTVEYTIICDGCSRLITASSKGAYVARREVRELGGTTGLRGGRDLCPDCARGGPS